VDYSFDENSNGDCLVGQSEGLRGGIWPTSPAIWAAAIYMALFLIRPWETLFPWLAAIPFERFYVVGMIAVVASTRGVRLPVDFQTRAVLLFLTSLVLSAIFAFSPTLAWNASDGLYVYITLVVFYFILVSVVRTPYELVFLIVCYLAIMGIYLGKCQWEFWIHGAGQRSMGVMRLRGISEMFGHPNALAASTAFSLPIWYSLYRTRDNVSSTWSQFWRIWYRRALLTYPVLAAWSVVLTNSRGGMLAMMFFGAIVVFRGESMRRKLQYSAAILMIVSIAWAKMDAESKDRFRSIWDPTASTESARNSADGRTAGLRAGIAMFYASPITGSGIGNFTEYRRRFVDGGYLEPHNLAGQALGETGLLGSGCFLLMILATIVSCRRTRFIARHYPCVSLDVLSEIASGLRDAVIVSLFCGLFSHNLYWFVWLWIGAFSTLSAQFARTHQLGIIETNAINLPTRH
jgi:O-antigen ligase